MSFDSFHNFAEATIQGGFDAAATTIQLVSGGAARFPNPTPFVPFNITVWNETTYKNPSDDPNRELMRVTSLNPGTDQLVVVRGQETSGGGLAASTKNAVGSTYKARLVISKKFFDDLAAILIDFGAQYAYVTEFGAKGDGTTDDTTAINAAITAGNQVVFPPGTYLVNGGLVLKSALTLQGAGQGVTTIRLKNSCTGAQLFGGTSLSDVTIERMTLDGNETNNATNGDGIKIDGLTRGTFQDLEIKSFRKAGIILGFASGSVKYVTIRDCRIRNCHANLIDISNRGSANVGNLVAQCRLEAPGLSETTVKAAIDVRGPITISDCEVETVHDNTQGIALRPNDGTLGNGAHDSVVSNCRISGTAHASNVSVGVLVGAERCRITNVYVTGTDRGFQTDETDGDDTSFVNCTAKGCVDEGFVIVADRNQILGCHTEGATTGISISASAADTTIADSYIAAGTTKVGNSSTTTHARGNRNWKTQGTYKAPADPGEACDSGTDTFSVTLDLDVTPLPEHFRVTMFRFSGTNMPAAREIVITGTPTSTNVDVLVQQTAVAATTFYKIGVTVDALP